MRNLRKHISMFSETAHHGKIPFWTNIYLIWGALKFLPIAHDDNSSQRSRNERKYLHPNSKREPLRRRYFSVIQDWVMALMMNTK